MPAYSYYAPYGLMEYSSLPTTCERVHTSMQAAQGEACALDGHQSDRLYASAMALSGCAATLQRLRNSFDPGLVQELLPDIELDYGIVPPHNATVWERRSTLAAKRVLALGGRRDAIETALTLLLGSDFVAYRTTTAAEAEASPENPDDSGSFISHEVPPKLVSLVGGVDVLGSPVTMAYSALSGSVDALKVGEELVVEPGRLGCQEAVTITAATSNTVTAIYTRAHEQTCMGLVGAFPVWSSNQRHSLVIVSASAAIDSETRRAIDEFMQAASRGVSTWDIVDEETTGYAGPFRVGVGRIGVTTIGQVSV